jgi:fatty acid desaturase
LGDVKTLTVREYLARSLWGRLCYRLYRHPIVMFGIGPAYLFVLQQRLPVGMLRTGGWRPWLSTMATNFAIALVVAALVWFVGVGPFLLVHLPITLIAGSVGVWLFYVQHQFDPTFWLVMASGRSTKQPCMAVHITNCREFCAGSRQTSACTTSTICAAVFRITACREHSATIPSSARRAV